MNKIIVAVVLLAAACGANADDFSPTCEKFYRAVDKMVENAGNAGKAEATEMKKQLQITKQQMKKLSKAEQEADCRQGMEMLKQMSRR